MTRKHNGNQSTLSPATSAPPQTPTQTPVEVRKPGLDIAIEIPRLPALSRGEYISRHADVNRITIQQATALRRLADALDANGEKHSGGRRCVTNIDAIKWLLDRLANVAELQDNAAEAAA